MKFISIVPINNMDELFNQYAVMLLAHLSKKYPEYSKRAAKYDGYKIMDNSIIEIGESFTMKSLVEEADKCKVNEIILPDVFNNGPETVKKVKESIKWLKENNYLGKYKLMAVCHGRNKSELLNTFNSFKNMAEIDVIGLPKVLCKWMNSRIKFARFCYTHCNKEIHLLGCYNSLAEYQGLNLDFIRSTDTCMPALLSINNMGTWENRNGRKIDLEKDSINIEKYKHIMKDFYENSSI